MEERVTISVIKADVGGLCGHTEAPEELLDVCDYVLEEAVDEILIDYYVTRCGDDINLIMTHRLGIDNEKIHGLAWRAFEEATKVAKELKLYGAGQDLLAEAFSGNVRGMGPGCAEMEFVERPSEPVIVFCCDKTDPSVFNLPLYRIFADPFNTAGLVYDKSMINGFKFDVLDVIENKQITLKAPEESYQLLALIGNLERYCIKRVHRAKDNEIAAVVSSEKLNLIAGRYVGKDDPVAIVRAQSGMPAVGEVLEAFATPHFVPGWMRGCHWGPLMPVSEEDARPARFDGPPRIMALGFQISNGKLIGPNDLFDDVSFNRAREKALEMADMIRRMGPFQPHRLPEAMMEYTSVPEVLAELKERFVETEKVEKAEKLRERGEIE
ncbi:fructose-1,6-bisphosphate aldolase/phosphatase [Methanofervidicoccus abyssi]|uniref:Fructose-1,6-bisphosphate aldolase/phosphatase n=1 Tax=Methanofervidicoccus abyssi TaxID=2082189 RepID=A0A401HRG2_9EURY|nr:fructose-1,6-bisphosphate aldolase/phosphatase [Methanofervidicoccus abyssi]GBF36857.1 fructose 1,6-bisphosphate aldolase/phosphatase [Methanofervidicoccus abyssi]